MRQWFSAETGNATGIAALFVACFASSWSCATFAQTGGGGANSYMPSYLPPRSQQPQEELYLEVYLNEYRTNMITSFRRYRDGCLTIERSDLSNYRLKAPESAIHSSGGVCLERMPGLTYRYDAPAQAIHLTVPDELRETLQIDARGAKSKATQTDSGANFSAIFNYALTANFGTDDYGRNVIPSYQGAGAYVDAHFFSNYGNFDQSGRLNSEVTDLAGGGIEPNLLRLDSRWFYDDDSTLVRYAAGDVVSGSLGWTRSIRMGGFQISRDFSLRPDLVTQPLPSFSGSAAVPSTVEVFADQSRTFSQQITGGPFTISNLPVVSGPGVLTMVVRDPSGKETSTEYSFYASSRILAPGFYDSSIEGGFARTYYDVKSDSYDENPVGSASLRYGLTDRLTLEAHTEDGDGLANLGAGAVFGLWRYGIASFAASASDVPGKSGGQVSGSFETSLWKARLYLSSLRSFGDYQDLASVTAPKQNLGSTIAAATGSVYKRQDQISLSLPLTFDAGTLNFSYTDAEDAANNAYKIASVSYSRPFFWNSNLSLTGFNDFDQSNSWGVYAGLTFSWGKYSAGAIEQSGSNSSSAGGYFSRSLGQEAGSYGYSIRAQEGSIDVNSASVSYRAQEAQLDAGVQQVGKTAEVTASAAGSVAFMNGVYFANRIDNSFAIVDTGIPGVTVLHDNHPVGETDSDGRILIPSIRAREENSIMIDPATLPAQADIDTTQLVAIPRQRGGSSVHFKGNAQPASAVVAFKDEKGAAIPPGSEAWVNGVQAPFVIGYDGESYITNLQPSNAALVKLPDGSSCNAAFDFASQKDAQARIDNVICKATASAVAQTALASGPAVKSKQ